MGSVWVLAAQGERCLVEAEDVSDEARTLRPCIGAGVFTELHLIRFHGVLAPNAKLLKRVFNLGLEHYPNRGGELKVIAARGSLYASSAK
jgi:hypothetical protein